MGSLGNWGKRATVATCIYIVALWLWDNKWVILGALAVGLALGWRQ